MIVYAQDSDWVSNVSPPPHHQLNLRNVGPFSSGNTRFCTRPHLGILGDTCYLARKTCLHINSVNHSYWDPPAQETSSLVMFPCARDIIPGGVPLRRRHHPWWCSPAQETSSLVVFSCAGDIIPGGVPLRRRQHHWWCSPAQETSSLVVFPCAGDIIPGGVHPWFCYIQFHLHDPGRARGVWRENAKRVITMFSQYIWKNAVNAFYG